MIENWHQWRQCFEVFTLASGLSDKSNKVQLVTLLHMTRPKAEWHWHNNQEQSFKMLKQLAIETPVLKYFDPKKPTKLSVDASSKGLGAVLLQEGHPITYASRALTQTQQNYAQIEKEMLAILFGCT